MDLLERLFLVPQFTSIYVWYMVSYDPIQATDPGQIPVLNPETAPEASSSRASGLTSGLWRFRAIGNALYWTEGLGGLYRGIAPTLITMYILPFLFRLISLQNPYLGYPFLLAMSPTPLNLDQTPKPVVTAMLLYIPSLIITYRAIVTPHRLPWFAPQESLRLLLAPAERKKPWLLWLTPGLVFAQLLHIAISFFVLPALKSAILYYEGRIEDMTPELLWRVPAFIICIVTGTLVLAPLQVMITRLAVQRNLGAPELLGEDVVAAEVPSHSTVGPYADEPKSQRDVVSPAQTDKLITAKREDGKTLAKERPVSVEVSITSPQTSADPDIQLSIQTQKLVNESVVRLRPEDEPYRSLYDCFQKINREEGLGVLYRMWWITLFCVITGI